MQIYHYLHKNFVICCASETQQKEIKETLTNFDNHKKKNKNLKTLINKIETKIKITTETDIFKKDMDEILELKNKKKKIK